MNIGGVVMIFEDELMERQADLVGHILEFYKDDVDKLYIWIESKQKSFSFNVFAVKDNKIIPKEDMDREEFTIRDFLEEGVHYIHKEYPILREKYGNLVPSETKMIYDVKDNFLEATYKYDGVDGYSEENSLGAYEIMELWEEEVKKTLV